MECQSRYNGGKEVATMGGMGSINVLMDGLSGPSGSNTDKPPGVESGKKV